MRPVNKGSVPKDKTGHPKVFRVYAEARADLIERMGQYCSYCNQKLGASLAIEHVKPKSLHPDLATDWDNFLLACVNCNSHKSSKAVALDDYLWPDVHNTHLAYEYHRDGTISIAPGLSPAIARRAQKLLDLVQLQVTPDTPKASDRRWKNRNATYLKALESLALYKQAKNKGAALEFEKMLAMWATDAGFFSIWMHVFRAHPTVTTRFIQAFAGTAPDAFDGKARPQKRTACL